ncbi:MAG: GAF domain-containing protein [Chloroflexia bacterium]|nr:GAF domain-containing protein [Chloroflexia bacterium]
MGDSLQAASADKLATILELSQLVCSSLDLAVVFERILTAVRDLSHAEIISIMLLDDQREQLEIVASYGLDPAQFEHYRFRLGEGIAGWVARYGEPVHTCNPGRDVRFLPRATPYASTLFVLPLRVRDRILGVINMVKQTDGVLFNPEIVQMVAIFADYAAIAIDNAAAASALRYAATRERLSRLVSQAPRQSGVVNAVVERLLDELRTTLEVQAALLVAHSDQSGYRLLAASSGFTLDVTGWTPVHPELACTEINRGASSALQLRLDVADTPIGWLLICPPGTNYVWQRGELELAHFAADQMALLLANDQLFQQEQQNRALIRTLNQLATASHAMVGRATLLDFILEQLQGLIAYDSSGIFLFHDDNYARMEAGRGFQRASPGLVLYMGPGSLTWDVRQQRQARYLPDVQELPGWQAVLDSDLVRSWIGTPLIVDDTVIGILTIDKWVPGAFTAADVQVAQLFADHVVLAINNQRLLSDAQTRASQLQLLHQTTMRMGTYRALPPLFDDVARLLQRTFGYYQLLIATLEGESLIFHVAYGVINDPRIIYPERRTSYHEGLLGWTARTGETLLVNDVQRDPRYQPHPRLPRLAASLVVALKRDARILGIIGVASDQTGAFSQHDLYLLEAVAAQTVMVLEQLRQDQELRDVEDRIAQSERLRALGELASGVAHDFNNLLASILGHIQLLLDESLSAEVADELRIIERSALDGAATVRRLQNFAQTNRVLPHEMVDLAELIEESLAMTRPVWREAPQRRGILITVITDLQLVPPFAGDAPALREMITNLLLNAVDAMPSGGQLTLHTALVPALASPLRQPSALIQLSDTGVGMSQEVQARMFDPFYTTKGSAGTGMGLAMVYGIVQQHLGQIVASSELGVGSTFKVYLPIRSVSQIEVKAPSPSQPPLAQARRLLVVEDDPSVRRVLVRQIQRLGYHVTEAADGATALALLAAQHFDLLCTDLGMPGLSGWQLIDRVRMQYPDLTLVLISGWGDQLDSAEARAHGVHAILAKPFDLTSLQRVLYSLLDQ